MPIPSLLPSYLRHKIAQRFSHLFSPFTFSDTFFRSRGWDIHANTVIDVGASDGRWSMSCRRHFRDAAFFLIEAQPVHAPALYALKQRVPRLDYVLAAAGDAVGEIYFDASAPFAGVASHVPLPGNCLRLPMTTIDHEIQAHNLQPPFLLKFDTHGFEVPILEGSVEALKQTDLIVIETYNFTVQPDSLRFHEMCAYLEARGFRCADLCDPLHRPKDSVLWQMDLLFIPATKPVYLFPSYA